MVGIIDNRRYDDLDEVVRRGLSDEGTDRVRIAVGYLYVSGPERLHPELDEFLDSGGTLQILMRNPDQQWAEKRDEPPRRGGMSLKGSR